MKDLYVSALLDVYGSFLSEKQQALTEYYYNDDFILEDDGYYEGFSDAKEIEDFATGMFFMILAIIGVIVIIYQESVCVK